MSKSAFDVWFGKALDYEGRVNEDVPGDGGGPTHWGITIGRLATIKGMKEPKRGTDAFYQLKSQLYALTEAETKAIYRRDYWDAVRGDDLPPGVNMAVSDYGLNSGPSRAVKALQRLCGNPETGRMDDETVREAHAFDRVELIMLFCDERERFLNAIVKARPGQRKFLKGWLSRVGDVRRASIAMAEKNPAPEPAPKPMPKATPPAPPPVPSVAKEAAKSRSVQLLVSTILGYIADFFFGIGSWISERFGDLAGILKTVQSESDENVAPLVSLAEKLHLNAGKIAFWALIVTLIIVVIRHINDKVALAHAKAGTEPDEVSP